MTFTAVKTESVTPDAIVAGDVLVLGPRNDLRHYHVTSVRKYTVESTFVVVETRNDQNGAGRWTFRADVMIERVI